MCSNTLNGDLEIPSQDFQIVISKFQVQFGNSTHGFYLSIVDVLKVVLCAINNDLILEKWCYSCKMLKLTLLRFSSITHDV